MTRHRAGRTGERGRTDSRIQEGTDSLGGGFWPPTPPASTLILADSFQIKCKLQAKGGLKPCSLSGLAAGAPLVPRRDRSWLGPSGLGIPRAAAPLPLGMGDGPESPQGRP